MEKVTFEPRWVESARAGDQDALTGLYKSTYHDVYLTIKMLLRHDEDTVMDLLQDTYIKAFTKLDTLGDDSKFPAWVSTIARNTALNYLKREKPLLFSETLDESGEVVWEPEETEINALPEDALDLKDTSEIFNEILDSIPEKQRIVVTMHYYMEMSQPHIARTLGISEGTVKSRLSYGKKAIESKIYEVEKRDGIRLHAVAPFTFFLWLLKKEDSHAMEPDPDALSNTLSLSRGGDTVSTSSKGEADPDKGGPSSPDTKGPSGSTTPTRAGDAVKGAARAAGATATKSAGIKIVATIAAIGVIGSGAAYGVYRLNGMQEPEDAQVSEEGVAAALEDDSDNTAETKSTNPEVIYAEVLDYYYNSITTGWADYEFENADSEVSFMFAQYYSDPSYIDQIGYAFIDLNGDDVDELLIGMTSDEETYRMPGTIYDLFTYMNGQIYDVATSGERFRYQLCSDNTIYFSSHDGAGFDHYTKYKLNNSNPVYDVIDSVYSEPDAGVNNIYWYRTTTGTDNPIDYTLSTIPDGTAITESEADSIRNEWSQPMDYELTYFGDYTSVEGTENNQNDNNDYSAVLNTYKDFLSGNVSIYDTDIQSTGLWTDSNNGERIDSKGYFISNEYTYPFYYSLYDINDDGTDELIIMEDWDHGIYTGYIKDILTMYNGKPTIMATGAARAELYISENGSICRNTTAGNDSYYYYTMHNGTIELIKTAESSRGEYSIDGVPCSEEEFNKTVANYPTMDLEQFEWIPLS